MPFVDWNSRCLVVSFVDVFNLHGDALKCLVIGDLILDSNTYGTATRLCPEAPVPVVVPSETVVTRGGAGLVADQLAELIGVENVISHFGSKSRKERIFADGRLICRTDYDSIEVSDEDAFRRAILPHLEKISLVIVSDYGKGALNQNLAAEILWIARAHKIPVFVDAKTNWEFYAGAFAAFPNNRERSLANYFFEHTIEKNGERGCFVDETPIYPQHRRAVRDCTGAGDTFLAAFVAHLATQHFGLDLNINDIANLRDAARFANHVAGLSVEYVGTRVIKLSEIYETN